ncbi:hypothetical protein EAG_00466, partial [Camponotus floridanus]
PVLVAAKIFIQDLWMAGLDWDQSIPLNLRSRWLHFAAKLPELNRTRIPRWTGVQGGYELHAFCDASERAYAAAVYLRGIKDSGEFGSSLLIAKTKVAPLRPVSIPRLELCGALLAARLLRRIATELQIASAHLYAWTDARVVLAWIRAHPSRWTAFVANRVAAIQEWLPPVHWRYVSTQENPADLATRGIAPSDLESSQLWWTGPQWLKSPSESWYAVDSVEPEVDEERRSLATVFNDRPRPDLQAEPENDLLCRFSSFNKLIRVSALCLR